MNNTFDLRNLCLAAATLLTLASAQASTSIASLASEAGSSVSDSASTSLNASSASSADDTKTANGDYRIINIAQVPNHPDRYRLTLRSEETHHELTLDLPATTWTAQGLTQGDMIHAKPHAYGLEFARVDTQQAFFLVLHDDWYNELKSRPLNTL